MIMIVNYVISSAQRNMAARITRCDAETTAYLPGACVLKLSEYEGIAQLAKEISICIQTRPELHFVLQTRRQCTKLFFTYCSRNTDSEWELDVQEKVTGQWRF
jgi:hypothetical protein